MVEDALNDHERDGRGFFQATVPRYILGAVITSIVAIAVTNAVDFITRERDKLEYDLTTVSQLFGELEDATIYTLSIKNSGDRPVSELRAGITFGEARITDHEIVAPPALQYSTQLREKDTPDFLLSSPLLNVGDSIEASFIVDYAGQLVSEPVIDVRAEGVTGHPSQEESPDDSPWLSAFAAILAAFSGILAMTRGLTLRGNKRDHAPAPQSRGTSTDSKRAMLTSVCLEQGLKQLAHEYVTRPTVERWWLEADYLMARALDPDDDAVAPEDASTLLKTVVERAEMAPTSASAYYFNVGLLASATGQEELANEAKQMAYDLDSEEYRRREARFEDFLNADPFQAHAEDE